MRDQKGFYYVPDANNGQMIQTRPDFFAYNIDFDTAGANNNLAAGANATGNFIVQAAQYFLWQQSTYEADTAHGTLTDSTRLIPLVTVQLSDQNSNKVLTNSPTMVPNIFGTGQLPFILPNPRLCMPQSVIQALVANVTSAVNYNLRLTFIGLALFPTGKVFDANFDPSQY